MKTLWIDVEDLFEYARRNTRPSGIQRVAFELQHALETHPEQGPHIAYVRHTVDGRRLRPVPKSEVHALYQTLTSPPVKHIQTHVETARATSDQPSRLRRLALRLPTQLRVPLGGLLADQRRAITQATALTSGISALLKDTTRQAKSRLSDRKNRTSSASFAPDSGDILLSFGAAWSHATYGALLHHCREHYKMRVGLLTHDLIPLLWPEWCPPGLSRVFQRWYDAVIPECDLLFAVSHSTRNDILNHASQAGLTLRAPVTVIPMGTTLPTPATPQASSPLGPAPAPYVLIVSTIEARKNHALLFRVWRHLLSTRAPDTVPKLVFAGRPGWLVADLMQQIRNSNFLNGHIILINGPSDTEIDTLYQDALFTVFPSFYEGWGLPVTESHIHGRLCVISSAASLSEAAGPHAPRFDPDNTTEALAVIKDLIDHPEKRFAYEKKLKETFTPTSWSTAAQTILDACQQVPGRKDMSTKDCRD